MPKISVPPRKHAHEFCSAEMSLLARASGYPAFPCKRPTIGKYGASTPGKLPAKKSVVMKLFPNFYVFIYEARAKLYVAEKHHDHSHKTPASSRRPPEPYTGTARGTPSAPRFGRAIASGSSAPGLF